MKLELGCGLNPCSGYDVYHDRERHHEWVNVAHDLNALPWPWADENFTEIMARDVMEHLSMPVGDWLDECWRILRPGGALNLRVPFVKHQNAWTDPNHLRWFTLNTFDYWDPDRELYQLYGCIDHARSGRLWEIVTARYDEEDGNLYFILIKRVG